MTQRDLARKFLERLRRMPNPTPAKLLGAFRHLLAEEKAKHGG